MCVVLLTVDLLVTLRALHFAFQTILGTVRPHTVFWDAPATEMRTCKITKEQLHIRNAISDFVLGIKLANSCSFAIIGK